ncbi:hypothetical protein C8R43DRAFT_1141478 [Mycena crocata]|nr:hypothetical protein C8R43DRAFT_1141478 [Mycena crocata]
MSGKAPKPATGKSKKTPVPEVAKPPPDYFTFLRQLPSAPGVFTLAHPASLDEVSPAIARTVFTPEVMKILVENSKWLQPFAHQPDFPPQILYLHGCMKDVCAHIDPRGEHPEWNVACWNVEGDRVAAPTVTEASGSGQAASEKKRKRAPSTVVASRPAKADPSKPALRKKIQPGQEEVIVVDESPSPESPPAGRPKTRKGKSAVKSDAQVRDDSDVPASPVASGPAGKSHSFYPFSFYLCSFIFLAKPPKSSTKNKGKGKAKELVPVIYTHYNKHSLSKEQREALFKILPAGYSSIAQPITTPDGDGFKIAFSDIRRGKGLKSTKDSPRCIECISSGAPCATVASGMYKDKAAPEYLKWIEATPFGLSKRFDSLCQAFDNVRQIEKIRLPLQAQFDLQMLLYLRDILRLRQTCQTFEEFVASFRSGQDCEAILRVAMVQMLDARSEPNQEWVCPLGTFYDELDAEVGRQTEPRGFFFVPANNALMYNAHWVPIKREDYPGGHMGPSAQPSGLNPTKRLIVELAAKHGKSDFDPTEAAHLAVWDPFVEPPSFKGFLRGDESQEVLDLLDLEADEASDDHESFINDEEEPDGDEDESESEEEAQAGQQDRQSGDETDGSESSESEEEQPPPTKRRRVIPYGTTGRLARLPSAEWYALILSALVVITQAAPVLSYAGPLTWWFEEYEATGTDFLAGDQQLWYHSSVRDLLPWVFEDCLENGYPVGLIRRNMEYLDTIFDPELLYHLGCVYELQGRLVMWEHAERRTRLLASGPRTPRHAASNPRHARRISGIATRSSGVIREHR